MIPLDSWAGLTRLGHLIERLIPADTNDVFPEEPVMQTEIDTPDLYPHVRKRHGEGWVVEWYRNSLLSGRSVRDDYLTDRELDELEHAIAEGRDLAQRQEESVERGMVRLPRHVPPGVLSEHPLQPGGAA